MQGLANETILHDGLGAWHFGGRDASTPRSENSASELADDLHHRRRDLPAGRACPSDSVPTSPERTPRSGPSSPRWQPDPSDSRTSPGLGLASWGDGAGWTDDDSDLLECLRTRESPSTAVTGPLVSGPTASWADRATPACVSEVTSGQVAFSPAAAYLQIPTAQLKEQLAEREAPAKQGPEALGKPPSPPPARRRCRLTLLVARCPACFALVWFLAVGAIIGAGVAFLPFTLDTSFDSFHKADANASLMHDSFQAAVGALQQTRGRKLRQVRIYRQFDFSVAYELKSIQSPEGIFEHRVLRTIANFEHMLRSLPEWQDLCAMAEPSHASMCEPGISFASYALPSKNVSEGSVVPSSISPDGLGRDVLPLEAADYLVRHRGLTDLLLPKHYTFSPHEGPTYLRSSWRFKVPVALASEPSSKKQRIMNQVSEKWRHLIADVLLEKLQKAFPAQDDPVRVWWEGTDFSGLEVMQVFWADVRLACGSVLFVLFYLGIHTRSPLLTIGAFLIIPLSMPVSYIFFALVTGSREVGIINFLSVFIIIGLGADVIFVYSDMWRDSALHQDSDAGRLAWTYSHAGKATLATSGTTALAFLANLASALRPLREFGLFMGICITCAWVLISLMYVPLCLKDERLAVRGGVMVHRQSKAERRMAIFFGEWAEKLSVMRLPCCVLPSLLAVVFCGMAFFFAAPSMGMPELFPANHNQNRGVHVFGEFQAGHQVLPIRFNAPPSLEPICSESNFHEKRSCTLHWCEAARPSAAIPGESVNCSCFRRPSSCSGNVNRLVNMRFAGIGSSPEVEIRRAAIESIQAAGVVPWVNDMWVRDGPSMLMEDWGEGSFAFVPVTEVTVPVVPPSCGWDEQCYCGIATCNRASLWQPQAALLELPGLPAPSRLLTTHWTVPVNRRASVEVVYGLELDAKGPFFGHPNREDSWRFRQDVDFRSPWAQRDLYKMCTELPGDLRVVQAYCWIVDFRTFLRRHYPEERFPLPPGRFDMFLLSFAASGITGHGLSKNFLWIRDGSLKACFLSFQVDVDRFSGIQSALDYKEKWDRHLARANLLASDYAQGAIHVSGFWATTEAHRVLVSSTALSLGITLTLSCLTMLVFTGNCCLSVLVVVATVQVISGLFFFMVVVMSWTIGPIEVLALIVFVGYALDYSLHVAQKYGHRGALTTPQHRSSDSLGAHDDALEARLRRVKHSLKTIGGANLGSAITTSGCALFLIFCQLTIFKKLGIVVVIVTLLSILTALVAVPAMLLLMGPLRLDRPCCLSRRRLQTGASRAFHLAKNPDEIPAACLSLLQSPPPEEVPAKDEASTCDEALAVKSSWRKQSLKLEDCFEIEELSMGLQTARISMDPILEVARARQAGLPAGQLVESVPQPGSSAWAAPGQGVSESVLSRRH